MKVKKRKLKSIIFAGCCFAFTFFFNFSLGQDLNSSGYTSYNSTVRQENGYGFYDRVTPETGGTGYSFYGSPKVKTGWWWYENLIKPSRTGVKQEELTEKEKEKERKEFQKEEVREKEERKKEIVEGETGKTGDGTKVKPLEEYTYEELLYMSPEEFRKVFDHYFNLALTKPTEENMFYFFNVVDVARKKAALFTSMYAYTTQKYWQYLPAVAYPSTVPGVYARIESQRKEVEGYVYGKAGNYGIIVFVKPGCPYCEAQLEILKPLFMKGIDYKIVDVTQYPEVISKFGIEVTPTVILVHRSGEFLPIASGVQALESIEVSIMRALQIIEGALNPGQYGIYEFQKGTPLDPFEPSPLWRNKNKEKR